jgi:hypothetical protein
MPMGMPYPKGNMAMGGKPSMSEMMGVEKPMPMPMPMEKKKAAAKKGKKSMPFKKK